MGSLETNRDAAAEIRRAQEAARKAAMERARLLAAQAAEARQAQQAQQNQQAEASTVVSRDTFVQEAEIEGLNETERGELFDEFDTDGETGLSETEFNAAWSSTTEDAPAPEDNVSEDVQEELDNAFKDDDNTDGDLMDAAGKAESADDVHAIMAAAEARGVDQEAVLQEVLNARDELADNPNTEMFEAVAGHYERLEQPERAAAVRLAGSPDITREVRGDLVLALQDGDDTAQDLKDAAKHTQNPEDLAAVLQVQRATGEGDTTEILQHALLGLDEEAETPNSDLLNAIADEFEAIDKPDHAAALRRAADPETTAEWRKEIIHSLQDDKNTEQDIRDAARLSDTDPELEGTHDAADANELENSDAIIALGQVDAAKSEFDAAAEEVARVQQDIQALADTGGLTAEQKQVAIQELTAQNQEKFDALTAAQENLASAVEANQEGLTELLKDPSQLEAVMEADTSGFFESGTPESALEDTLGMISGSLEVVARDPAHFETAQAITTEVLVAAQDGFPQSDTPGVVDPRTTAVDLLTEKVVPGLIESNIAKNVSQQDPNDPEAVENAFTAFEDTPLHSAIEGLGGASEQFTNVADLQTGYTQLKEIATGSSFVDARNKIKTDQLQGRLDELSGTGAFGRSFAGLGAALNAVSVGEAWKNGDAQGVATAGTDTAENVAALMATGSGKLAAFGESATAFLGPVANTLGVLQGVQDAGAAFSEFQETGDNVALLRGGLAAGGAIAGVAALMAVPGANVAGVVIAGALLTVNYFEGLGDDNDQASRIMGAIDSAREKDAFDPPLTEAAYQLYAFNLPGNNQGHSGPIVDALIENVELSDGGSRDTFQDMLWNVAKSGFSSRNSFMEEFHERLAASGELTADHQALYDELARQLDVNVDELDL